MNHLRSSRKVRVSAKAVNARLARCTSSTRKYFRLQRSVRGSIANPLTIPGGVTNLHLRFAKGVTISSTGVALKVGSWVEYNDANQTGPLEGERYSGDTDWATSGENLAVGKWIWAYDSLFVETHQANATTRICTGQLIKVATSLAEAFTFSPQLYQSIGNYAGGMAYRDVSGLVCENISIVGARVRGLGAEQHTTSCSGILVGLSSGVTVKRCRITACYQQAVLIDRSVNCTVDRVSFDRLKYTNDESSAPGGYGVELNRANNCTVSNIAGRRTRYVVSYQQGSAGGTLTGVFGDATSAVVDTHGGQCSDLVWRRIYSDTSMIRLGNPSWRFTSDRMDIADCYVDQVHLVAAYDSTLNNIHARSTRIMMGGGAATCTLDPLDSKPGVVNTTVSNSTFTGPASGSGDRPVHITNCKTWTGDVGPPIQDLRFLNCSFDSTAGGVQSVWIEPVPQPGMSHNLMFDGCTFVTTGLNVETFVFSSYGYSAGGSDIAISLDNCSFNLKSGRKICNAASGWSDPTVEFTFHTDNQVKFDAGSYVAVTSTTATDKTYISAPGITSPSGAWAGTALVWPH